MRPPGRSSAAGALWPAAASGSNSRSPRAPYVGARRTCVPPRKYWLARTRTRGVTPRTNPPSLFSCAPHLQPTITGRQGRSCANNRWAIPEHQSGPIKNIEASRARTAASAWAVPLPILGIDTDNGSEFINEELLAYCANEQLTFTRGRVGNKNDACFIELCGYPHNAIYANYAIMPTGAQSHPAALSVGA